MGPFTFLGDNASLDRAVFKHLQSVLYFMWSDHPSIVTGTSEVKLAILFFAGCLLHSLFLCYSFLALLDSFLEFLRIRCSLFVLFLSASLCIVSSEACPGVMTHLHDCSLLTSHHPTLREGQTPCFHSGPDIPLLSPKYNSPQYFLYAH